MNDEIKKDVEEIEKSTPVIEENTNGVFKTVTEKVKPLEFTVEIRPEDWVQNGTCFAAEIACPGIYKDGINRGDIDTEKMKENAKNMTQIYKLINDIYEKDLLKAETESSRINFLFVGDKPTESIFFYVKQLPFPDCPGSKLGLE